MNHSSLFFGIYPLDWQRPKISSRSEYSTFKLLIYMYIHELTPPPTCLPPLCVNSPKAEVLSSSPLVPKSKLMCFDKGGHNASVATLRLEPLTFSQLRQFYAQKEWINPKSLFPFSSTWTDSRLHICSQTGQMRQHSYCWFLQTIFFQFLACLYCVREIWMTMQRSKRHSSSSTSDNKDTNKALLTGFHWRMKKPIIGPFVCFL